jgi:hypothetical protein
LRNVQVGQCGNQVGCRFWELALREHAAHNKGGRYDDALSSFFQNVDTRTEPPTPLPLGDGRGALRTLRVRRCLRLQRTLRAAQSGCALALALSANRVLPRCAAPRPPRRAPCWWTWRRAW